MSGVRGGAALEDVGRLYGPGTVSGLSEWQLVERFARTRDEGAFAAIVGRHSGMVMGACRRVLDDPGDVEDAFQATFLVLLKKVGTLRPTDALGPWLYGVAQRVALRGRSAAARRRSREAGSDALDEVPGADGGVRDPELGPVLDEELRRLPAHYRSAVVVCYLEGLTHEEAARELGWPLGTVKGRLSRAREMLRSRLTRRGFALTTTATLAGLIESEASASSAVPAMWVEAVVRRSGEGAAGAVPVSAAILAKGVIRAMLWNQLRSGALALGVLATVLAGAGALAQGDGKPSAGAAGVAASVPGPSAGGVPSEAGGLAASVSAPGPATSTGGVPPEEAASALRAREATSGPGIAPAGGPGEILDEMSPTMQGYTTAVELYALGKVDAEAVNRWSKRLVEDQGPAERDKALGRHVERMKKLASDAVGRKERGLDDPGGLENLEARYFVAEAEKLAKAATAPGSPRPSLTMGQSTVSADRIAVTAVGNARIETSQGAGTLPGMDARSQAILKKLDAPISMNFNNETPLEDVLKYIKSATQSSDFPTGLAIYVEPQGLMEAERTMTSPVSMDLEGVPLKRTLHLMLAQLGLCYRVEDGMIYVTSKDSGSALPPPIATPSPISVMQQKAERGELSAAERKEFIETLKDLAEIDKLLHPEKYLPKTPGRGGFQ